MPVLHRFLFPALWLGWAVYWVAMARDVKVTARRESRLSWLSHMGPLLLAALLLLAPSGPLPFLGERFLPRAAWPFWAGAALTVGGLLFSVWARRLIGRNWSGTVTVKEDHELITNGPYAIVRHPIYTGLLLAFTGTALARGDWHGVLAVAIAFGAFWRKLRFEERWMLDQFGAAYRAYCRRVAALVPRIL